LKGIVMGDRHYELIYSTAYSFTGNAADAEEIAQTIFVRLLRSSTTGTSIPSV